jgi:Tfp pilus assembly protein PilX
MKKQNSQNGVSLYLTLMIMSVLLAMALGLSTIFLEQTKTVREIGNSVLALCAADAGLEEVLINRSSPTPIPETALPNGATYQVFVTAGGVGACPVEYHFCIKSIGSYSETRRAIEITY